MSCHDIGRGVDFIMEKVLEMYDDGKISKEKTEKVIPEKLKYAPHSQGFPLQE